MPILKVVLHLFMSNNEIYTTTIDTFITKRLKFRRLAAVVRVQRR